VKNYREYTDASGVTQATLAKSEKPEDVICDFCSSAEKPQTAFECRDFPMGEDPLGRQHVSTGGFNACPTCAKYVESGNREALLNRSVENFMREVNGSGFMSRSDARAGIKVIHDLFFRNRNGGAK